MPSPAWPLMVQRVTHALKNPLTHMLWTIQRLQAEYRERAPAVAGRLDPYVERIQDGIGQLRRLTSSFLKLVDVDAPDFSTTDLNEVVSGFCERFRAQMPPDIRLRFDPAPALPTVRADAEQLEVALDNLLTNALNAMDSGGTITVATAVGRRLSGDGGPAAEDEIILEVLDTGAGVPAEIRQRIFDAGFSTAPDGSGLGLAIVRKIAQDHDGDVTLDTKDGVGTCFQIRLPVRRPEETGSTRKAES